MASVLLPEEVATRLVPPGSVEPAEPQPALFDAAQVQVGDAVRKRNRAVVVALDGEDGGAPVGLCGLEDQAVRDIATGDHGIGIALTVLPVEVINVGENQQFHHGTCRSISLARSSICRRVMANRSGMIGF